jgi:hypothetical protein
VKVFCAASLIGVLLVSGCGRDDASHNSHTSNDPAQSLGIHVLSTRPDMVTGGDALVRIDSSGIDLNNVRIVLADMDISHYFQRVPMENSLLGLVDGLQPGPNTLTAMDGAGSARSQITLLNHPITGPVVSGPHLQPFVCTTTANGLGPALDPHCTAETQVNYFYRNHAGDFRHINDITAPYPEDMRTISLGDTSVPFIIRLESGTINRAIYHLAVLDDPHRTYGAWDPVTSWNQRLAVSFDDGCGTQYTQGWRSHEDALNPLLLSKGFAHLVSSFNVMGHQCNDALAAETLMLLKEHFIENFGIPQWTVGLGSAAGAAQQLLIAQNFPGLLDGLLSERSLSDIFTFAQEAADCRLLRHYFEHSDLNWTAEKINAVTGYASDTCTALENSLLPVLMADIGCELAEALIYHPDTNPSGARCTLYDSNIASVGRSPETGFANQLLDNVGVQYGLQAMRDGIISVAEFLDMNTSIGGLNNDGQLQSNRHSASIAGLRMAYRSGRINLGAGSLGSIPIIQYRPYTDELDDLHNRLHDFQTRQRLLNANGNSSNQLIWVYPSIEMTHEIKESGLETMTRWLDNLSLNDSDAPPPIQTERARPATATDACWDSARNRIDDTFEYEGSSPCSTLYPTYRNPRLVAGSPLAEEAIKCSLAPAIRADYPARMTSEEWTALQNIFSLGVCDYTQAGPGQEQPAGTFPRLPL